MFGEVVVFGCVRRSSRVEAFLAYDCGRIRHRVFLHMIAGGYVTEFSYI